MSNHAANDQMVEKKFSSREEVISYAISHNIPERNALEKKTWLMGFALILNRKALDEIRLLDTLYSPGCFEDNGGRKKYTVE